MNKLTAFKQRTITATIWLILLSFILPHKNMTGFLISFIFAYISLKEWPKLIKNTSIFYKYFWTIIFIILPFVFILSLNELENRAWGMWLMAIVFTHDSAAYIVGSYFGKHKILPKISPNKSWQGCIAGYIITIMFLLLTNWFNFLNSIIIALFISVMATTGDMCESYLKRNAGIKDTGNFLPGHGGLLDRFDAIFFLAPWWYFLTTNIVTNPSIT